LEYMAQKNRESDVEYIRELQFLQDSKKYIEFKSGFVRPNIGDIAGSVTSSLQNTNIGKSLHGVTQKLDIGKAKQFSDDFSKTYSKLFNVKSSFQNLSTKNLSNILTSKVVAGRITSVASKISGTLLGRTSANNLPPSLRGTLGGRFTQIGSAFKSRIGGAAKAIGSFFKGFF